MAGLQFEAGKSFNMFAGGTTLDGSLSLKPDLLSGTGIINMPDSRINFKPLYFYFKFD